MRKFKEALRSRLICGLSFTEIARALQLSKEIATKYVDLEHQRNLDWAVIEELNKAKFASNLLHRNKAL